MNLEYMMKCTDDFLSCEEDDEKTERTVGEYRRHVKMFTEYLQEHSAGEISKSDIMNYKKYLYEEKKYRISYINNQLIVINKFIKFCELHDDPDFLNNVASRQNLIKIHNSRLTVRLYKVQKKSSIDDVVSPADFKRMRRMAKETDDSDLYWIMTLISRTGLRVSELNDATVEAVDKGILHIKNKGKYREVPVPGDVKRKLLQYCKSKDISSGLWFTDYLKDGKLNYQKLYRHMKRIGGKCRGIDLKKVKPHSLRHLFAQSYIKSNGNANMSELSDILGHSNVNTTAIYTRTTLAEKKRNMENVKIK